MEAASQKLPILSTPISAIPEFIDSSISGILSDDAPAALAEAMLGFAADPELGPRLAEAAHARLQAEFTMAPGIRQLKQRLGTMLSTAA